MMDAPLLEAPSLLAVRTLREFKACHVLVEEGSYTCLDLSLSAGSLPGLLAAIWDWCLRADPSLLLPAAPTAQWERFASLPLLSKGKMETPLPRGCAFLLVRGERR